MNASPAVPCSKLTQGTVIFLVILLLLLRFPWVIIGNFFFPDQRNEIIAVFEIGTYILLLILIYLERDRLNQYFISPLALGIILFIKPLQPFMQWLMGIRSFPLTFPQPESYVFIVAPLALILALTISGFRWKRPSKEEWAWLGRGMLVGLGASVIFGFFLGLQQVFLRDQHTLLSSSNLWQVLGMAILRVPQQMGYAAISEEPLFRGFLWGLLAAAGWKEKRIWLFQAGLFAVGHLYYIQSSPVSFWLVVPAGALLLGGLAWRSQTLASSLGAHAVLNAASEFFVALTVKFL